MEKIKQQIKENPIMLYMKGSPKLPACGFSAKAVKALIACGVHFSYVNVLTNQDIRINLPKFSNWPTFPQLWVEGKLMGGSDLIVEMYLHGELQKLVKNIARKYNFHNS